MSLPFLSETAAEVHRLAIAGSSLAAGDYRLKKLVPSLEGMAAKAPIFGRIATAVNAVVDEKDAAVAGCALLDLSALLTAIQYTQGAFEVKGELRALITAATGWTPTIVSHRSLASVISALTSTGQGRVEIVKDALERGLFKDLRLMKPAVEALHDNYGEMSELVSREVLPQFGATVIPMLLEGFDPKGGKPHARRVTALCGIDPMQGREFCRRVLENANKEVKLAVIEGLTGSAEDLDTILDLTKEKSGDVRKAAILALQGVQDPKVVALVRKALTGKDAFEAAMVAASTQDASLLQDLLTQIKECAALPAKDGGPRLAMLLRGLRGSTQPEVLTVLTQLSQQLSGKKESDYTDDCLALVAGLLYELNSTEADRVLIAQKDGSTGEAGGKLGNGRCFAMAAAARTMDAEQLYDSFSAAYAKEKNGMRYSNLLRGMTLYAGQGIPECPGLLASKISPRWVASGIKRDDSELVAAFAAVNDAEALKYLLKKEVEYIKQHSYYSYPLAPAIIRIAPAKAARYVIDRLLSMQKLQPQYCYGAYVLFRELANFPATALTELEAAADQLQGQWSERYLESIAEIRHRTAQATTTS
jgi:hypothetical protein